MGNCSENKIIYHRLCSEHPEIPLFLQAWWMESVCSGKSWDVILVRDIQGKVVAFMPFLLVSKWGFKVIAQPLLSQANGIWIFYDDVRSEQEKYSLENFVVDSVEKELKSLNLDWYFQYFSPLYNRVDAFAKLGYATSRRQTFVIQNLSDTDALFRRFSSAKQRQIRKAQRANLKVDFDMSVDDFVQFHTSCLKQKGVENFHSYEVESSLCREAIGRNQGAIIRISDERGQVHAALFFVWDTTSAYYLIPAINQEYKSSGASTLMVWETINVVKDKVQKFDFEGSMDENIARSYKQFGTERVDYYKIERINSYILKLLRCFNLI